MINTPNLLNALASVALLLLFFAMLWIIIFSAVHQAMKLAIKEYWPEEKEAEPTTENEDKGELN